MQPLVFDVSKRTFPSATFARTSVAYKEDGTEVAPGAPRYEAGQHGKAIVVEEGTTNLVLWSDDYSNAYWTKGGATISDNVAVAPDGTMTADKLVEDVSTGAHRVTRSSLFPSGAVVANGIIAKAGERSWLRLFIANIGGTDAFFNLANGTIGTTDPGVTARIVSLGNAWYWCSLSDSTGGSATGGLSANMATANGVTSYTGDGVSGLYLWRSQGEIKGYGTSPMKTEGATATRGAERLTVPTAGVVDSDEGTIELLFYKARNPVATVTVFSANDGTVNNRFNVSLLADGKVRLNVTNGGVNDNASSAAALATGWHRLGVKWSGTDWTLFVAGVSVVTLPEPFPAGLTTLHIGTDHAGGTHLPSALYDDLRISSTAHSDAQIAADAALGTPLPVEDDTTLKLSFDDKLTATTDSDPLYIGTTYRTTRTKTREYREALTSETRNYRVRAQLLKKNQKGSGIKLELHDWNLVAQEDPRAPAYSVYCTVSDSFKVNRKKFQYLLRLTYGVWLPESGEWKDVDIFTGPIHELARNPSDGTIEINASSKESQHLDPSLLVKPFNVRKGIRIHRAIRMLFEKRGEPGRFRFPRTSRKLNKPRSWPMGAEPWRIATRLANQIDRDLFYRGNGDLVLQRQRKNPVWKFKAGQDCIVTGHPSHRLSISQMHNMVVVKGGKSKKTPDGKRKRTVVKRRLRDKHPLSAQTLTGGKRPRMLIVNRDKMNKKSDLKQVAKKQLKRHGGEMEQDVTLTCLPIPHLELGDPVVVNMGGLRKRFRVRGFTMNATEMTINHEAIL